jgi:ribosomal protein L28
VPRTPQIFRLKAEATSKNLKAEATSKNLKAEATSKNLKAEATSKNLKAEATRKKWNKNLRHERGAEGGSYKIWVSLIFRRSMPH